MTTGTLTKGVIDTEFYSVKAWSGGDGKQVDPKLPEQWNAYTVNGYTSSKTRGVPNPYYPTGRIISGVGEEAHIALWDGNDVLKLYNKLADKARGHSFNLGIAAAESPQLLKTVALNLNRVSQAYKALKAGRLDLAARALGTTQSNTYYGKHNGKPIVIGKSKPLVLHDISAAWLEIQYAWYPVIKDIYEAMKAFSAITDLPRVERFTVRTSRELKSIELTSSGIELKKTTKISLQMIYEMTEALSIPRSLGLTNPATILWEKTPWSFVIDWAIPIGSYLDALGVIPALQGRFCETKKVVTTCVGRNVKPPDWAWYEGAALSSKSIYMTRTIPVGLSVPFPEFKPLNKILTTGHVLNALALLHQQSRSSPRDATSWLNTSLTANHASAE